MLFNSELVDDYLNLLVKNDRFLEAVEAKYRFIKHLKDEKEIDHQIRRSYLEIVLLYSLAEEKFKIKDVIDQFF